VLFVVDHPQTQRKAYAQERASLPEGVPVTLVYNKCDVAQPTAQRGRKADAPERVLVSATTGEGIDARTPEGRDGLCRRGRRHRDRARARHVQALQDAAAAFERAEALLHRKQGELVAEEVRQAQQHLAAITGGAAAMVGKIFRAWEWGAGVLLSELGLLHGFLSLLSKDPGGARALVVDDYEVRLT
jgi:tRNA U34 5-carboxymethylaminomethyl modifying GTPase MnmE/TrmE